MLDPEILAPVGNRAMLEAALAAGADAVYLGGKTGNARAFAGNFHDSEMEEVVQIAHLNHTKVYLTLNTLVKDTEIKEILKFAEIAWLSDIDAVIVQDLGLAAELRRRFPDLLLHASTQMNTHSLAGVRMLESMGFKRVILGRETSLDEIKRIRANSSMEIELFVHGSLCVSVSGQCLFSSLIGGRSGNRGRCAQSCRKLYSAPDLHKENRDTLISLRDLNTVEYMQLWKDLGIASLKIEGRMKKPEYVYAVTKMLHAALRGDFVSANHTDVSSRAFTKGFTLSDFGKEMTQLESTPKGTIVGIVRGTKDTKFIEIRENLYKNDAVHIRTQKNKILPFTIKEDMNAGVSVPLYEISDAQVGSVVTRVYSDQMETELRNALKAFPRYPIHFGFSGKEGTPLQLTAKSGTHAVTLTGKECVTFAENRAVTREQIEEKLKKTGNSIFDLAEVVFDWPEGLFISMSEINRLRREAMKLLADQMAKRHKREFTAFDDIQNRIPKKEIPSGLILQIDKNDCLDGVPLDSVLRIYTSDYHRVEEYQRKWKRPVYAVQTEPLHEKNEKKMREILSSGDFNGVLVGDPAGYEIAKDYPNLHITIDTTMNLCNELAASVFQRENLTLSPSIEMSREELEISTFALHSEHLVFGPVRAMWLRHCPFSVYMGCIDDSRCDHCRFRKSRLTDEHGASYPIERLNGYSSLYFYRCLDRIDSFAESKIPYRQFRLSLRHDSNNAKWVQYAKDRLLLNIRGSRPKGSYWETQGYTNANWLQGVE